MPSLTKSNASNLPAVIMWGVGIAIVLATGVVTYVNAQNDNQNDKLYSHESRISSIESDVRSIRLAQEDNTKIQSSILDTQREILKALTK